MLHLIFSANILPERLDQSECTRSINNIQPQISGTKVPGILKIDFGRGRIDGPIAACPRMRAKMLAVKGCCGLIHLQLRIRSNGLRALINRVQHKGSYTYIVQVMRFSPPFMQHKFPLRSSFQTNKILSCHSDIPHDERRHDSSPPRVATSPQQAVLLARAAEAKRGCHAR